MSDRVEQTQYVMGHSQRELTRLIKQSGLFALATRHVLSAAGISRGMSVLDVGSGAGDVSFAVAKLVGSSGRVVGIDRSAEAVELANARACGLTPEGVYDRNNARENVAFVQADLNDWMTDRQFDAVVGRFVLLHQADPVASLRQAARHVQPDGLIVFQEFDFPLTLSSVPHVPLFDRVYSWIRDGGREAGWQLRTGLKLYPMFLEAGLPAPTLVAHASVEAGADLPVYEYLADIIHSLSPLLVRKGIARAEDIQIETLAERLRDESVSRHSVLMSPPVIGAWTRK